MPSVPNADALCRVSNDRSRVRSWPTSPLDLGVSGAAAQFLAITIVVLPLMAVTIMFGELIPKVFGLRNNEWVCLRLSPVMEWFTYCVWFAVWLFETSVTLLMKWGERHWKPSGECAPSSAAGALQELRAIAAMHQMFRDCSQSLYRSDSGKPRRSA